jgi:hypothetical protein
MIRTVEPFDWLGQIRSIWPDASELREGSRVYGIKAPHVGNSLCLCVADNRTLVCDEASVIGQLVRHAASTQPHFTRSAEWKNVEHDLVAIVFDNHAGRIREATKRSKDLDKDDLFARAISSSKRWVFGLADSDDFLVRTVATCHDSASAQITASLISTSRRETLDDLRRPHKDSTADDLRIRLLAAQLVTGLRVEPGQDQVRIEPSAGVKLAELLPFIAKNGL